MKMKKKNMMMIKKKHDDATADEHDERYDDDNISPLSCSYHPVPVAFVNGFRTPRPRPFPQVRRHAVAIDHLMVHVDQKNERMVHVFPKRGVLKYMGEYEINMIG